VQHRAHGDWHARTGLKHVGDDHGGVEANVRVWGETNLWSAEYPQYVVACKLVHSLGCSIVESERQWD
jgi:hypothetical protein